MSGTDTIEKYMENAVLVPYKEMVLISLGSDTGVCVPWADEMFSVDTSSIVDDVYKELLSMHPKPADKAEPKSEEIKAEPKSEEIKAEPKFEEVKAEPKFEEVKAEPKFEEVKAEPNVKDHFKWKHFSSLITRRTNAIRYIKIPIDADLSVRYYMEFADRPTYVGKWFIKSHAEKAYTSIVPETAELLVAYADEYQLISGEGLHGRFYKTVLSHKKGHTVKAELVIE